MNNLLPEKGIAFKGENAWEMLDKVVKQLKPSKVFILTDNNTYKDCLPYLLEKQKFEKQVETLIIPAGEEHKVIATCLDVWNELSEKGADRNSLIINLGGGVVTDLGGFVASTYRRGNTFINIPTTLLGMVDASVGGKNGVDLGHLKNQIGVINIPQMVVIDSNFLKTLPQEQLTSGLAEMLKHGLISNYDYWNKVKNCNTSNKPEFDDLIWESIEIKEQIVTQDPFEKNLRKTLNYGHTLGHAIESYCMENPEKQSLLHGESVAIGLILATYISCEMFGFRKSTLDEITTVILNFFPKQTFTQTDIANIINLLVFDKKNKNGKVLFVLLEDIGIHKTNCEVENSLIYSAFEYYKNF